MEETSVNGFSLVDYIPPVWAKSLGVKPCKKLKLCQLPTPIHEFKVPGLPKDVKMYIKRDDMTGGIIGGNKHRKLEFFMADAIDKGFDAVLTAGTISSSHSMATSTVSKLLGMDCFIINYTHKENEEENAIDFYKTPGTFLPTILCSTNIYKMDKSVLLNDDLKRLTDQETIAKMEKETGKNIYGIPIGGSNSPIALYAYIEAWKEMMSQGLQEKCDDVAVVWGTGGTGLGLAIGNYLTGSKLKIHAFSIVKPAFVLYEEAQQELVAIGLGVKAEDIVSIIDIHDFLGYRINRAEDFEFIADVSAETGVLCDRVYVGKALKELVYLLNNHPQQFQGNKILFIHTGGMVGQFDGEMANVSEKRHKCKTNIISIR